MKMGFIFAVIGLSLTQAVAANAASIIVTVANIKSSAGEIGCALFSSAQGFPMETQNATEIWQPANKDGVVCRMENVSAGTYAVAVTHDLNANHKIDTNFFGSPTEDWGVSNNVRPSLRAPRFDEAKFVFDGQKDVTLTIEVDQ